MAAGILPEPGTDYGPCEGECSHRDCKETKEMAKKECPECGEKIGYGVRFYEKDGKLYHASCLVY